MEKELKFHAIQSKECLNRKVENCLRLQRIYTNEKEHEWTKDS